MSELTLAPAPRDVPRAIGLTWRAGRPGGDPAHHPMSTLDYLTLAAAVVALARWGPGSAQLLTGAALYLLGPFGLTIAFNVPLNNALAKLDPTASDAPARWRAYDKPWTNWNHARTLTALAATAAFILALRRT